MANPKNYLGNGWAHEKFDLINVSISLEKLNQLEPNEYGDVKITIAKMKEPNAKTKATHTVYENDYGKELEVKGRSFNDHDDPF